MSDYIEEPADQGPGTENNDPFNPVNVHQAQLIVQMRIYDVLMALLRESNAEAAKNLYEYHAGGGILSSAPSIIFDAD